MHRKISWVVIVALLIGAVSGFKGCKAQASTEIKVARTAASIPLTAQTIRDIGKVLVSERILTPAGQAKLTQLTDKTVSVSDQIAGDLEAGKFDPQAWDAALSQLAAEWTAISAIIVTNIDPRVNEWVALIQYLIPLIKSLIDKIDPPPAPATPIILAEAKAKAKISPGGIAALVTISIDAAIKYLSIQQSSDVGALWAKYHEYSTAYKG